MSGRLELLFLCQTLPFPPDGGVWIRSYHVLRLLAETFDVTALCFERTGGYRERYPTAVEDGVRALGRFGDVQAFPVPQSRSRLRLVWDHLRSTARRRVYTHYLYESAPFRSRLEQLLGSKRFDLVHCDSLDLAAYLPACGGIPIACVHHNLESDFLRRRARAQRSWIRRRYVDFQAGLTEELERAWASRVGVNVMVSESDRERLRAIAPEAHSVVVPNGVDVHEFRPEPGQERGATYVGGIDWFPNQDALDFFCEDILPELRAVEGAMPVRWVGSASPVQQRYYRERYGVEVTGYVEDVKPFMRDSSCNIVPLRVGGGTRLKILHSWAMGKAVVSTTIGAEGLEAVDGENILIRDDPRAFAEAIVRVERDADLRRRLGQAARRTAETRYSWNVVGAHMRDEYLRLLAREKAGEPASVA